MSAKGRHGQSDGQHAGSDRVAAQYDKYMREPKLQTRLDDVKLRRGQCQKAEVLGQQGRPQKNEIRPDAITAILPPPERSKTTSRFRASFEVPATTGSSSPGQPAADGAICQRRATRKRNAFPTTLTDESAIAAAAMIGDSKMPNVG